MSTPFELAVNEAMQAFLDTYVLTLKDEPLAGLLGQRFEHESIAILHDGKGLPFRVVIKFQPRLYTERQVELMRKPPKRG